MRAVVINHRWKIILIVTGFNLLFEYSLRGINNLVAHPTLPLFIFPLYFCWFSMTEDLIGRFKLRDVHVALLAYALWGIGAVLFLPPRFMFAPPLILGINWGSFAWVTLAWWVCLQSVMPFYLANRLSPRQSWKPLLSRTGWAGVILVYLAGGLLFRASVGAPWPTVIGRVVMLGVIGATVLLLRRRLPAPGEAPPRFEKSRLMDVLVGSTILLFVLLMLFFTADPITYDYHPLNQTSLHIVIVWTTIVAVLMLVYQIGLKRNISV